MRKTVLMFTAVIIIGFLSGYFSEPVVSYFHEEKYRKLAFWKKGSLFNRTHVPEAKNDLPTIKGTISAEDAITAVKSLPEIKKRLTDAASRRIQVSFKADQAPSRENPVWLLEMREVISGKVPDIMFFKVDAFTGAVLDLRNRELQVGGITPGLPISEVFSVLGNPVKNNRLWDAGTKKYNNIYVYRDVEIMCDSKNTVTRVSVTGSSVQGPRGIRTGIKKEEAIKKLGKAEITQDTLLIYNTMDDKSLQMHIKLDTNSNVSEISLLKITPAN